MRMNRIVFVILPIFELFSSGNNLQLSTYIVNKLSQCPDSEKKPMRFNGTITHVGRNKFEVDGDVRINQLLTAPLEVFHIQLNTVVIIINCPKLI